MKRTLTIAVLLMVIVGTAGAEISPMINYQGRLTDESGAPIADNNYLIKFKIYGSESGQDSLWSSGFLTVAVSGGLFERALGPFPNDLFTGADRYLGITVGTDAEISPRTRMVTVPYAYEAMHSDTAQYALQADNAATADLAKAVDGDFVLATGDTMTGVLGIDRDDDGYPEAEFVLEEDHTTLQINKNDTLLAELWGSTFGSLHLKSVENTSSRVIISGYNSGGQITLNKANGMTGIELNGGYTGNLSARFPDDAIDSDELLNEVGLATDLNQMLTEITNTSTMVEIDSVTIVPPADGYIYVMARYNCKYSGTTGQNGGYVQISKTLGASIMVTSNLHIQYGFPTTGTYYDPGFYDYYDYADSGTPTTYYLQARKWSSSTGTFEVGRGRLTAFYIPTSYEAVKKIVSDPDGFTIAEPVTVEDADGNTYTAYEVDLRELELKAKQKKIEALEAQLELEKAKERLEHE
ncbi:MAG: hypothetical protein R3F48_00775 [Candidatus Zixiibacteriota bacterium]